MSILINGKSRKQYKLDIAKRWRLRMQRHFWRESYFNDLLKRLETNSDVDTTIVEIDKAKYRRM